MKLKIYLYKMMRWLLYPRTDVCVNNCFSSFQTGLTWNLLSLLNIIPHQETGIYVAMSYSTTGPYTNQFPNDGHLIWLQTFTLKIWHCAKHLFLRTKCSENTAFCVSSIKRHLFSMDAAGCRTSLSEAAGHAFTSGGQWHILRVGVTFLTSTAIIIHMED